MGIAAAFAGTVLAIPASAEMTVSGSFTQTMAFGDYVGGSDESLRQVGADGNIDSADDVVVHTDNLHFHSNSEIHFTGTGTTDGGLSVQARVELDADNQGDIIDEQWISVAGDFGKVTVGNNDPAHLEHGYVGIAGGYGDIGYYDGTDTYTPVTIGPGGYNDGQSIRYSTPAIGGFSAGVSYHPDARSDNDDQAGDGRGDRTTGDDDDGMGSDKSAKTGTYHDADAVSVAGSYSSSMGAFNFTLGGGILNYADGSGKDDTWGLGAEFGFGATTIFLRADRTKDTHMAGTENKDTTNLGIALEHQAGATKFGIGYARSTKEDATDLGSNNYADDESSSIVAGAKHSLGGGVSLGLAVAWGEVDDGNATTADDDGTSVGAHIAFSF